MLQVKNLKAAKLDSYENLLDVWQLSDFKSNGRSSLAPDKHVWKRDGK